MARSYLLIRPSELKARMKVKKKPRIALLDLLRRRSMTLAQFIVELGITTFSSLEIHCERLGVAMPTLEKFEDARGNKTISSPSEGVVVIEPEALSDSIEVEFPVAEKAIKKPRRKKTEEVEAEGAIESDENE